MKKQEKVAFVDNLTQELKSSKSLVLIDFTGLTVKKQQELQKRLKDIGSKMLVVKNTLFRRASETAKLTPQILTDTILSGQTALVTTNADPITCVQILGRFSKELELLNFKAAIIEDSFYDKESLIKLSMLAGKDALFGQLMSLLAAPSYQLVGTLNSNMQKLVYLLEQERKRVKE
ncbi:50S ribosomal protein L10 [Candidatus Woesebacteria bacterium RIFCSPHIGHO2_02_FULL_38_9]|nr:MAG: 50S ribosomal protein L10 [Candidatus Woesebacteria bacterium RIFCSPHIGHO2_02_FULL_38_9]